MSGHVAYFKIYLVAQAVLSSAMKPILPLPLLIVAQLVLQSTMFCINVDSHRNIDQIGVKLPPGSSSPKIFDNEIKCEADATIANCIKSAAKQKNLTIFANLAKSSNLEEVLNGTGPYTVFVPTDEAFSALGGKKMEEMLDPANRERLSEILYLHVVRGNMIMKEISQLNGSGATAISLQGMWLDIAKEGKVNGARILNADIKASNGTIHVIDSVILPASSQSSIVKTPTEGVRVEPKIQGQTSPRVIKVNSGPNEPVKIAAVKLRGGEQIKSGISFPAVDDWVRGLTLTVTNVSKKPICFIHIQLHLPHPNADDGEAANDALMFTCNPVYVSKPNPLMPGKSMNMVLTDSDYIVHEALLQRYDYPLPISDLELKVIEVEFLDKKEIKWSSAADITRFNSHIGVGIPISCHSANTVRKVIKKRKKPAIKN